MMILKARDSGHFGFFFKLVYLQIRHWYLGLKARASSRFFRIHMAYIPWVILSEVIYMPSLP
jgi:hypothetical protein